MKNTPATPQRLFGLVPNATHPEQAEISFTSTHYAEVLESLLEQIAGLSYFNGRISTTHEGFSSVLTATLIIYHDDEGDLQSPVRDFVPIWWDMESFRDDESSPLARPVGNDFSLALLRKLLREGELPLEE